VNKSAKFKFFSLRGVRFVRQEKFEFGFRGGVFVYFLPNQKVKKEKVSANFSVISKKYGRFFNQNFNISAFNSPK
jgi:hypothetical protein